MRSIFTPFPANKHDNHTLKGYLPELGNKIVGGAITGVPAMLMGKGLAKNLSHNNKLLQYILNSLSLNIGALPGSYISQIKSEREAGMDESSVPQFLLRELANLPADTVVPLIGGNLTDFINRELIHKAKDNEILR